MRNDNYDNNKSSINNVGNNGNDESYISASRDNSSYISDNIINKRNLENELIKKRVLEQISYPKSSIPLLVINYYSFLYAVFYLFANSLLFVYKGFVFPYPPHSLGPEIAGFFFFITIQFFRNNLNNSGNKSETRSSLILSVCFSIPVIMGFVYLLRLQTYVLVFDLVMNIIGIVFIGLEIINIIIAIFKF